MDISLSLAALIVTRPLQFVHSRFCSVSMAIKGPTSTFYTTLPTNARIYIYIYIPYRWYHQLLTNFNKTLKM